MNGSRIEIETTKRSKRNLKADSTTYTKIKSQDVHRTASGKHKTNKAETITRFLNQTCASHKYLSATVSRCHSTPQTPSRLAVFDTTMKMHG